MLAFFLTKGALPFEVIGIRSFFSALPSFRQCTTLLQIVRFTNTIHYWSGTFKRLLSNKTKKNLWSQDILRGSSVYWFLSYSLPPALSVLNFGLAIWVALSLNLKLSNQFKLPELLRFRACFWSLMFFCVGDHCYQKIYDRKTFQFVNVFLPE